MISTKNKSINNKLDNISKDLKSFKVFTSEKLNNHENDEMLKKRLNTVEQKNVFSMNMKNKKNRFWRICTASGKIGFCLALKTQVHGRKAKYLWSLQGSS